MFQGARHRVDGLAVLLGATLAILTGCRSIPEGRSAIDAVDIRGASALDEDEVAEKISTAPSEKFLGLFRGVVYEYSIYDPSVLQRDLARIERVYRGHGFLEAHARAGRIERVSNDHVRVEILVEEGPSTINGRLNVHGLTSVAPADGAAVLAAANDALPRGKRFDEEDYEKAKASIKRALTDRGYAYAVVDASAQIDVGARVATYAFEIKPGPLAKFGKITIVGLDPDSHGPRPQEIDEAPLRRALNINEGDTFSTAAIESATTALLELEVFSAVEIVPDIPDPPPPSHVVALTVKVEPTRLRQVKLGGGAEFDEIKTDIHLIGGWEDHNFLGGLRDLSIDFKPGVVLYPLRIGNIDGVDQLLPEERLRLQFRQPGFLEARTSFFFKPAFNVFPLLLESNPDPAQPVVGYREGTGAIGLDRSFGRIFASLSYNAQLEDPFTYKGADDPALKTLVIAYPELVTRLDLRDDPTHPHAGLYLANDLQIAGGVFGGSASDLKVQPEVRAYAPLGRRVTFAIRGSIGFLFASNYGNVIQNPLQLNDPNINDDRPERVRDIQTTYFRGFFSGGPTSNRGYPLRGIAPHGVVPFLNPATASAQAAQQCNPNSATFDASVCSTPVGGFSLWELSAEFRFAISGPISAALFCDSSDVNSKATIQLSPLRPHVSCGVGGRYDTPVGPIRLDIGYRIQPLQILGYANEDEAGIADRVNGTPPNLFGAPIAIAFGIGEAY